MEHLGFKFPYFLLLLLPLIIYLYFYIFRGAGRRGSAITVSSEELHKKRESIKTKTYPYIGYLRFLSIFMFIIALAAPGKKITYTSIKNRGLDIFIALDLSGTMRGEDFQPDNRLGVAKKVVSDFISKRPNDRIGLVIFANDAYLQCPLTADHEIITEIVSELDFGIINESRTAIGDALVLSASRMMESKAKGKMILLITDGMNNSGEIDPETAAKTCAELNIKVYTVGIGKDGRVPYPNPPRSLFPFAKHYEVNNFNGESLQKTAEATGGVYFRADSAGVFSASMEQIDKLEKSETELKVYNEFDDRSGWILITGISLFFIEILLRSLFYRKLP
jgi:Ca-activated chloride channel family protein